jgi:uncharacterized protein YdhG (YjbR/CyaY superfamily)
MDIELLYEKLAAPARRALRTLGLARVEDLAGYGRETIAGLHGIGPGAMRLIEAEMEAGNVHFTPIDAGDSAEGAADMASVEKYIDGFPEPVRERLRELRGLVKAEAPEATERLSYGMPSFHLNGYLVHYAGYGTYLGFYGSSGVGTDMDEFRSGKGTLRFPLDRPLPREAIRRIVRFRVEENARKGAPKKPAATGLRGKRPGR